MALGRPWATYSTGVFLAKGLHLHASCANRGVNWARGLHTHTPALARCSDEECSGKLSGGNR